MAKNEQDEEDDEKKKANQLTEYKSPRTQH